MDYFRKERGTQREFFQQLLEDAKTHSPTVVVGWSQSYYFAVTAGHQDSGEEEASSAGDEKQFLNPPASPVEDNARAEVICTASYVNNGKALEK